MAALSMPAPASAELRPSLWLRIAAMVYELVLLFGVVFLVSYALLSAARWTYPLATGQRWVLQGVLFITIGLYFAYCWSRGGQTLAMKSWGLKLESPGRPLSLGRALLRYLLAWHLLLPSVLVVGVVQTHALVDLMLFVAGFGLMLLTVYLDPGRQFLHDRMLGTRIVRTARR